MAGRLAGWRRWMRSRPALETLIVGGGFALQGIFTVYFLTGGYLIPVPGGLLAFPASLA
jgi:hypothetical protein